MCQHKFSVNTRGYFASLKHEITFVWNVLGFKVSSCYNTVYECCSNSHKTCKVCWSGEGRKVFDLTGVVWVVWFWCFVGVFLVIALTF